MGLIKYIYIFVQSQKSISVHVKCMVMYDKYNVKLSCKIGLYTQNNVSAYGLYLVSVILKRWVF